jgi:hypothetical protein
LIHLGLAPVSTFPYLLCTPSSFVFQMPYDLALVAHIFPFAASSQLSGSASARIQNTQTCQRVFTPNNTNKKLV